jgi:hypothetical protein
MGAIGITSLNAIITNLFLAYYIKVKLNYTTFYLPTKLIANEQKKHSSFK